MKSIVLQSGKSFVARLESAGNVVFTAHYYDSQPDDIAEQVNLGTIEGEAFVTLVAAPTGSRVVKEGTFFNAGGDVTLVLAIDNGTDQHIMYRVVVGGGAAVILSQLGEDVTTIPGVEGDPGANVELREHGGYVQWRLAGQDPEADWVNLYELPHDGADGKQAEFRVHAGWIEWRYADQTPEDNWTQLFEIPVDGDDGVTPHIGENGNWFIGETDTGVQAEGQDGKKTELRYVSNNVEWRYADQDPEDDWKHLLYLAVTFELGSGQHTIQLSAANASKLWVMYGEALLEPGYSLVTVMSSSPLPVGGVASFLQSDYTIKVKLEDESVQEFINGSGVHSRGIGSVIQVIRISDANNKQRYVVIGGAV